MKIRELLDFVANDVPEPEKRIEKIFEWRHARQLETAKWALGISTALLVAWVASTMKDESGSAELPIRSLMSLLRGEYELGAYLRIAVPALTLFFAVLGLYSLVRGTNVEKDYAAALSLLARLKSFDGLIKRYRRE